MENWKTVRVADVAAPGPNAMATGPFGSSIGSRFFRSSGVPIIRGSNLSADSPIRINDANLVFLTSEKAAEFTRSTVRRGDLIFTSWGTINQVGLIDESASFDEYVISNKQMKLTADPQIADPEFLYYLFSGPAMQREILEGAIGSSIPGFNLTRLRLIEIQLPPVEEQKRIARALSDAECLQSTLREFVAKERALKQGVMQQLLTGRTRLHGFNESWSAQCALNDFCDRISGYWGFDNETSSARIPVDVIRAGDISPDGILTGTARRYFSTRESNKASCQTDDVIITASGNGLGKTYYVRTPGRLAASNFVRILRPHPNACGEFIAYLMYSDKARAMLDTHTATSAYPNLMPSFFSDASFALPPRDEQVAIAAALRSIDDDIDLLRIRQKKAEAVKQGMMQQLLAGRARLPVHGASA